MAVNTAKSKEYRKLRFDSIDQLLAEIDLILTAHHAGKLHQFGNWSPGQILAHLAAWIEYGYVGYPLATPPWILRLLLRMMAKRYITKGMPRGIRIPGIKEGTVGQDETPIDAAAERLKAALARLKNGEKCTFDSPAFGPMSHEDRIELNLRHAELHLGYLHPLT